MSNNINEVSSSISFPDLPDEHKSRRTDVPSIREICLTGIANGVNTPSIASVIKQFHPDTAAAAKSSKHIAWYRAWAKKHGNPYAAKVQA